MHKNGARTVARGGDGGTQAGNSAANYTKIGFNGLMWKPGSWFHWNHPFNCVMSLAFCTKVWYTTIIDDFLRNFRWNRAGKSEKRANFTCAKRMGDGK